MSKISHLKQQAIDLRKKGLSYTEILKTLGLKSKGTLSLWFKDLIFDAEVRNLLEKNMKLAQARNLFKANEDRSKRIQIENKNACSEGFKFVGPLSKRELALVGAALYWGEGSKSEKIPGGSMLSFCNSDPTMIRIYMKFLREILEFEEQRMSVGIHLYPTTDIEQAKDFWAEVTGLPREKFYIITQVSRASQGKRPYNILPHGTLAIKTSGRLHFFRVKGMIEGIGRQIK